MGPAPSTAAMTTSRMKPEMRETSVHPPTVAMRLIIGGRGPSFPLPACLRGVKQIQHLGQSRTAATPGGGLWKSESNKFHQVLRFVVCDSLMDVASNLFIAAFLILVAASAAVVDRCSCLD